MAHLTVGASAPVQRGKKKSEKSKSTRARSQLERRSQRRRGANSVASRAKSIRARGTRTDRTVISKISAQNKSMAGNSTLLQSLLLGIVADEIFKNGEDVPAVAHDAFEKRPQGRLAHRFAVPLREDRGGHSNVAPEFIGGMAAQKEPVEKRGLALRELEVLQWVVERIGLGRHW